MTIGILYIVPTPIGNLKDITFRAIDTLKSVDLIACEDKRKSSILLNHYDIKNNLISYHEHNEHNKTLEIINLLLSGKNIALISDAGTPLISDPGYKLIDEAIKKGINVVPLPGPSAVITALSASGFPVHNFTFLGFPPHKKGRKTFIEKMLKINGTIILFESVHRIEKLFKEIKQYHDKNLDICIARELTKIHEEFIRTDLDSIEVILSKIKRKGEFVILINNVE